MNVADLQKELRERDRRIDELLGVVERQAAEIERLKKRVNGCSESTRRGQQVEEAAVLR
jgi:hypothetical protein